MREVLVVAAVGVLFAWVNHRTEQRRRFIEWGRVATWHTQMMLDAIAAVDAEDLTPEQRTGVNRLIEALEAENITMPAAPAAPKPIWNRGAR